MKSMQPHDNFLRETMEPPQSPNPSSGKPPRRKAPPPSYLTIRPWIRSLCWGAKLKSTLPPPPPPLNPLKRKLGMIPKNSVHRAFDSSVQVLLCFLTNLNLFVGNLPFTVDSAQLVELFKGAGNVEMVERIAEVLSLNVRTALNLAFSGLKDFSGGFESAELSVILCNDECMRKHNKEWRDEDRAPSVVSKSKHVPGLKIPNVVLGDILISVEMVARQAEQRGHTLLDEMCLLMVVLAEALICVLLHEITFFIELFGPATTFEALLINSSWKLELKGAVLLVFANKQAKVPPKVQVFAWGCCSQESYTCEVNSKSLLFDFGHLKERGS